MKGETQTDSPIIYYLSKRSKTGHKQFHRNFVDCYKIIATGLHLIRSALFPLLQIGITLAIFQSSVSVPVESDSLIQSFSNRGS